MCTITYNIQMQFSSTEDVNHWKKLLNVSRTAYNECSMFVWNNNIKLGLKEVHQAVYGWMREKYPEIPAQGIIRIYKEVLAAIRSIKANKHKTQEPPQRKQLAMRLDKRLYANLNKDGISLSGAVKHKRIHVSFVLYDKVIEMFDTYTTSDPLIFMRDSKLYLSIPFNVLPKPCKDDTCVGVDLGIKRFITTSEGKYLKDKAYNGKRRSLRYLKRSLNSKGTKSAKRHLKKLSHKERNMSKSQTYKAVNALLSSTDASVLVLEDLSKIKVKTSKTSNGYKRKRHNSMMSQVPFYTFKEILTYKAQLVGKRVETVSPTWTSQTDCETQKRDGERHGCRYYRSNGIVFDADWNAAVNIGLRSKHPVSSSVPIDGMLTPLMGRVSVNDPIVDNA